MSRPSLRAFFELAEDDEEEFAQLVRRHAIDLSADLRSCDLSGVDFGDLQAPVLDLTGCLLGGADLSKVRCKQILTEDADITPTTRLPEIGFKQKRKSIPRNDSHARALVAVVKYTKNDWVVRQIVENAKESSSPIMAFYGSAAEQDYLTKRIRESLAETVANTDGVRGKQYDPRVLWFYTRQAVETEIDFKPYSLDNTFLKLLERTDREEVIERGSTGVVLKVISLQDNLAAASTLPERREVFVQFFDRYASNNVLIFSGYPPMSRELYEELRRRVRRRLKLIFLCSGSIEFQLHNNEGGWNRNVIPSHAISEPTVSSEDIRALSERIALATTNMVVIGHPTSARLEHAFNGKPLRALKTHVTALIDERLIKVPQDTTIVI